MVVGGSGEVRELGAGWAGGWGAEGGLSVTHCQELATMV